MLSATHHRRQRQKHTPGAIWTLPNEILCEIFEHVAAFPTRRAQFNCKILPAILATCTIWRANAFATPRLWSLIDFTYTITEDQDNQDIMVCTLDSVITHLHHSRLRMFDLRVHIDVQRGTKAYLPFSVQVHLRGALDALTQILLPHAHRCAVLTIFEEGETMHMFIPHRECAICVGFVGGLGVTGIPNDFWRNYVDAVVKGEAKLISARTSRPWNSSLWTLADVASGPTSKWSGVNFKHRKPRSSEVCLSVMIGSK